MSDKVAGHGLVLVRRPGFTMAAQALPVKRLTMPGGLLLLCLLLFSGAAELTADTPAPINRATLDHIIGGSERFLMAAQRKTGNFYGRWVPENGFEDTYEPQVQAEALWVLAESYGRNPNPGIRQAVRHGLQFFIVHSTETAGGKQFLQHPYGEDADTATVAFIVLTLNELLAQPGNLPESETSSYLACLQRFTNFLLTMQSASGRYHARYRQKDGRAIPGATPRSDGIILLALTRSALFLNAEPLKQLVGRNIKTMLDATVNAKPDPNFDPRSPGQFCEFGLRAIAEFAGATADDRWQRECVRVAGLLATALPGDDRRLARIPQLTGLAVAWPLVERYGNAAATSHYSLLLQEELGVLARLQIGGPDPVPDLPKWEGAGGGVAVPGKNPVAETQATAELLGAAMAVRDHLFPTQ